MTTKTEVTRPATKEELVLVRSENTNDDVQFDDDAKVAVIYGSENIWVQAWVYVRRQ